MPNNNKKRAEKRKIRHYQRATDYKRKKLNERNSILEETLDGQIIKDYKYEFTKDKVMKELHQYFLIKSYDFAEDAKTPQKMCVIC